MKSIPLSTALAAILFLSISGKAESSKPTTLITNPLAAASVLQYIAPSGKSVRKGDVLVVLDCQPILAKLHETESAIPAAETEVKTAGLKIPALEADKVAKLAALARDVSQAERTLRKYVDGDGAASESTMQLAVVDAQSAYDQAVDRYSSRDKLLQDGYIQKVEYDLCQVALDRAKLGLSGAKVRLETFVKYDKPILVEQYTKAVDDKKLAVETGRAQMDQGITTERNGWSRAN